LADSVGPETRSRMMAGIRTSSTTPELVVRRFLHGRGFRYRLHVRGLPGRPDLVLPKYHAMVFVHGCFWHAHEGCKYFRVPGTRPEFWQDKFDTNRARDKRVVNELLRGGWRVAVVWECATKSGTPNLEALVEWIPSSESVLEIPSDETAVGALPV
jgi:DNA mismatch endonuclease (patch repair protein)